MPLGYGVIGSPSDSGSVSPGSSPGTPADWTAPVKIGKVQPRCPGRKVRMTKPLAPLCSGLARRPLKAVARVRIPSGLPETSALHHQVEGALAFAGHRRVPEL